MTQNDVTAHHSRMCGYLQVNENIRVLVFDLSISSMTNLTSQLHHRPEYESREPLFCFHQPTV
jgi:hypothetical protein